MRYLDTIKSILKSIRKSLWGGNEELQPSDILSQLISELEKRKKLGIEENAFVPNVYAVYLSPLDYDELSPLLSGIRDQLRNKLMDRIKKKGYRLLSTSITIDLREDSSLQMNQVVVESSFLKEKTVSEPDPTSKQTAIVTSISGSIPRNASQSKATLQGSIASGEKEIVAKPISNITKIIEDRKTKIIDNTKVALEIIHGDNRGSVISLKEGDYTFGRGKEAKVLIKDEDETVSRVHFKLSVRDGRVNIKDLNSANGTKVNEIDIEEAELHKGDTITAGKVLLKVA
jgi:pSer/pThr/pTyr-binding forkhead associated (FHA) protein